MGESAGSVAVGSSKGQMKPLLNWLPVLRHRVF